MGFPGVKALWQSRGSEDELSPPWPSFRSLLSCFLLDHFFIPILFVGTCEQRDSAWYKRDASFLLAIWVTLSFPLLMKATSFTSALTLLTQVLPGMSHGSWFSVYLPAQHVAFQLSFVAAFVPAAEHSSSRTLLLTSLLFSGGSEGMDIALLVSCCFFCD